MTTVPRYARLHLLTLGGFAVAQPLYDLIGGHPEFLVAHRAGPASIALLVAMLSLGAGGLVVIAVEPLRWIGPRARAAGQLAAVALLGVLIAAGIVRGWPSAVALPVSLASGAGLAVLYRRQTVRTFLTLLTPSIVIFPLLFVVRTPVSRLVRQADPSALPAAIRERPPIVLVVFDELSTFDLLDASGSIDRQAFPALADLAATSTWFPAAVSPFPYTERAIPAILTGVQPNAADPRLPIAADHPRNLFTWLAGSYEVHASEPITELCPRTLCGAAGATRAPTGGRRLVKDVAALYLHLIAPRDVAARWLPSLTDRWQGFTNAAAPPAEHGPRPGAFDVVAAFGRASQPGRDTLFRAFIREIENRGTPSLHFIHALLPHDPYVFTPSGRRYAVGGLTTGMNENGVWTTSQALVDTARERHTAQARLADRLLGELLARLRAERLFDDALVIVTADHGAAFKPGESHRGMTAANATEIIAVPLLVKLPRQRERAVEDRPVSGLDIVPTIAGALRTALPWPHDGHDVLDAGYPLRSAIEYAGTGVGAIPLVDVRAAASNREYGPGALARTSAAPDLLSVSVVPDALPVADGIRVYSDSFARLQNVTDTGLFPALVSGEVQLDVPRAEPVTLALAVNGTIVSVTRTSRWADVSHYFTVLLPDTAIRIGANRLDVLQVRGAGGGASSLARIADDLTRDLTLTDTPAGPVLTTAGGLRMPGVSAIVGFVDRADDVASAVTLSGWAADVKAANPLRTIAAFANGRAVAFTTPHANRPDVTAALGLTPERKVSFSLSIPKHAFASPIRVFGISGRGVAGELQAGPSVASLLRAAR